MSTVLVVGSFPPIPLPAAAASVEAVRRAWEEGFEVVVSSPRLSAADLAVPIHGPLAGLRLERVRRITGSARLVLVIEPGFPVAAGPLPAQWATTYGLARIMRRFEHVTVFRVGRPTGSERVWSPVLAAAHEIVDRPGGAAPEGVTPLGPPETNPSEVPGELAGKLARRVLGSRTAVVRRRLGIIRRRLRAAGGEK